MRSVERGPCALALACLSLLGACREPAPGADLCALRAAGPTAEARLSAACARAFHPQAPAGTTPLDVPPLRVLAGLEARGELADLAAAWFVRGNLAQAAAYLKRAPPSVDRDSDLAAVAYARGHDAEALELLDSVLERRADHPQALWNRGLVLRRMDLPLTAAESFERVAARYEPGWGEAARAQATDLRKESASSEAAWKAAQEALQSMVREQPAAVPVEAIARFPGLGREQLYEVLRSAPDREHALALLPLAGALDRASGGAFLHDLVLRTASADFARRGPLAKEYAQLLQAKHPDPADLVRRLRKSGEHDLLFGALIFQPSVERLPAELEALSRAWDDPWLQLEAQLELARLDSLAGRHEEGKQRLLLALRRCEPERFSYQCLRLHRALSDGDTAANHLSSAEAHGRACLREAHRLGEWHHQSLALLALAQALRFQLHFASTRAYLREVLARSPSDAQLCSYVHRNLTVLALHDFHSEEARRELDLALGCGRPITLIGAWALSELGRRAPAPSDAERLARTLGELSPNVETPGRRVLALWIRGRFQLLADRPAGEALLRQAIASAGPLLATDSNARDSWTRAYVELVMDAALHEEWPGVLALTAEQLGVRAPERCAVAVVSDAERTAVVVLGADGRPRGAYDHSRRTQLGESLEGLVPAAMIAGLEGCPRVDVLTTSPLDTRAGLLPPELPWSYRVGAGGAGSAPQPPRHLVVANVEAPASLRLPRLAPWNVPGLPAGSTVSISGAEATPSRVLAAMTEATTIDVHAHGVLNPLLSGATSIALSPEPDGRYALTAEAIRKAHLRGAPVVSLAACAAAWRPAFLHETSSLPQAFIEAGARAVLASTVEIPDSAGPFFSAVRERIQAGAGPAAALRDERLRWLRADPRARWVNDVLLYE